MTFGFIKNKTCEKKSHVSKLKPLFFGTLSLLVVFSVVTYLIQVNKIAAYGFEIKDLEKQINVVKEENEKLAVKVVELQSMPVVQTKIADLGMTPVGEIVFLDSTGQIVARR